jgi:hypothetical protein
MEKSVRSWAFRVSTRNSTRLNVTNIVTTDGEGRPLDVPRRTPAPTATREFRTVQEALDAYEDLLVRYADWSDCPAQTVRAAGGSRRRATRLFRRHPISPTRAVWTRTSRTWRGGSCQWSDFEDDILMVDR